MKSTFSGLQFCHYSRLAVIAFQMYEIAQKFQQNLIL